VTLADALPKLAFLFTPDAEQVIEPEAAAQLGPESAAILEAATRALEGLDDFTHEGIEAALRVRLVDELGLKPRVAFGPVRVAISGSKVSPPLFESMELLGRQSTLARLRAVRG
jgi:glutamyl-tRNA synthetase